MTCAFKSKYFVLVTLHCCMLHAATSSASSSANNANTINSDLVDKMSWKCANNATCLYAVTNSVMSSYRRGEMVHFGIFDLVKLPTTPVSPTKKSSDSSSTLGRSIKSSLVEFLAGNALRIPIGPMVFSVQPAEEDSDYIEIALLKKTNTQARHQGGVGRLGGGDGDGGGFGGGIGGGGLLGGGGSLLGGGSGSGGGGGGIGGGGGGGGEGGGHRGRIRNKQQEKKQFQMLIPMYLAASTFGWTMVAAKAVGLLTLKALAISKLALLVASMVIIKKLMDNASEKMMYQFPEHSPYMMPYSMDYGMHPMGGSEIATGEMYPAAMHMAAGAQMNAGHPGLESLAAESSLHQNLAGEMHNNTQMFAALNAAGLAAQTQKVKREDSWLAAAKTRRPMVYNYLAARNPYYTVHH